MTGRRLELNPVRIVEPETAEGSVDHAEPVAAALRRRRREHETRGREVHVASAAGRHVHADRTDADRHGDRLRRIDGVGVGHRQDAGAGPLRAGRPC